MNKTDLFKLFEWLSITFPRDYGNLPDDFVRTTVINLEYVFHDYELDEVQAVYRTAFARQKHAPHPSEVLAHLNADSRPSRPAEGKDPTCLLGTPDLISLEQEYGSHRVRRVLRDCIQTASIEELRWRLAQDR